jgi:transcriptional antiterminator RfaH
MKAYRPVANRGDLWKDFNWFAIHTKPRREEIARTNVSGLGIESFLPRLKTERLVDGAARTVIKPLFAGYLFARFRPQDCLESVECCRGVLQVVSSGRMPIPVGEKIVAEIQGRVLKDGLIRIETQVLAPGARVRIQSGPFEGMMGRVERELDDRKRVAIFLETLFHTRLLIDKRWIEAEAA